MKLRVLHPNEENLFREAWRWRESYPRLVRRWDGFKHFRQWFALMKRRVSVGIFTDHLIGIATLRPAGNNIYEAHFDCERRPNKEALLIALLNIEKVVFEEWGAGEIFVGVISKNVGIIRIAETCGFQRDGIEATAENIRWIRMRITNAEYQDQYQHLRQQEYADLRTDAGGRVARHRYVERYAVQG